MPRRSVAVAAGLALVTGITVALGRGTFGERPSVAPGTSAQTPDPAAAISCSIRRRSPAEIRADVADRERRGRLVPIQSDCTDEELANPLFADGFAYVLVTRNDSRGDIAGVGLRKLFGRPSVAEFGRHEWVFTQGPSAARIRFGTGKQFIYIRDYSTPKGADLDDYRVVFPAGAASDTLISPWNRCACYEELLPGDYTVTAGFDYVAYPSCERVAVKSPPLTITVTPEHVRQYRARFPKL